MAKLKLGRMLLLGFKKQFFCFSHLRVASSKVLTKFVLLRFAKKKMHKMSSCFLISYVFLTQFRTAYNLLMTCSFSTTKSNNNKKKTCWETKLTKKRTERISFCFFLGKEKLEKVVETLSRLMHNLLFK